jgi:predicted MFS family arabinose efflux permease
MQLRWVMLVILFLVRLAMGYQFQAVASVSSELVETFGFSYAEIGTLIGFFLLPGIVVSIPSDLVTRAVRDKNLLLAGAAVMIAGALTMAVADGPGGLYAGRLIGGIGGTLFNIILTKMVTEWFFEQEIITALGVMLTAWPVGIALGLLSQGAIAENWGWPWALHACAGLALAGLVLTALAYREAPTAAADSKASPSHRYGLPRRQFIHTAAAGIAWTLYNASLIIVVSFAPGVLVEAGYGPSAARTTTSCSCG